MSRLVISGYYGFNNAGDEAVLLAIINSLKNSNTDFEITVLSNNPEQTSRAYQVKAVNRWKYSSLKSAIKDSDLLISGGGSLLQDVSSKNGILYYLGVIILAKFYKKPVLIYAQGIGPVNIGRNRWLVARVLNRTQGITVRDPESKDELLKMGVKKEIIISADPVLGLYQTEIEKSKGLELLERAGVNLSKQGRILGVSLRSWKTKAENLRAISNACDTLIKKGWEIIFIPMHFPEDIAIAREIMKEMKQKACILKENYNPLETLALFKAVDMVLGMRLHALIMAAVVQKPMLSLSYDPKVDSFMWQLGINDVLHINSFTSEEIVRSVESIWNNKDKHIENLEEKIPPLKQRALIPVKLVEQLRNNGRTVGER